MESFSTRQTTVVASAAKTISWTFRVQDNLGVVYYWSTGTITGGTGAYTGNFLDAPNVYQSGEWNIPHEFKIINFSGITLRRSKSESGIHAPNDVTFSIINNGNLYAAENFTGGTVRIGLVIDDGSGAELCGSWRFRIKTASPHDQQIDIGCEDFLQEYLRGSYPNTKLISSLYPSTYGVVNDSVCLPESYGTAYVPLRSVYASGARYYVLGTLPSLYTISEVRSPRELGAKIVWTSAGYSFTQSAIGSYRMFQPIIADSDLDGAADAPGIWVSGDRILDMPTKFSMTSTASVTNPADVIRRVLRNIGVQDYDLDLPSFETAKTTFTSWGLTWNFAFWYKQDRAAVLSNLLAMCHSCLIVGEQIKLQVLSKTSKDTITTADILKSQDVGPDTFKYSMTSLEKASDSGYVGYQVDGESQDEFLTALVPAKSTTAVIDSETIVFPGVQDKTHVQKLGILYYQRKFLKIADISFSSKGTLLALRPDDVVTISSDDYGGTYNVLIDEMTINADVSINLSCQRFSEVFDDWDDIFPGNITVGTVVPTGTYAPVVSGPDGTSTTGTLANSLPGRLRVGATTNYILLEPSSPIRISLYSADTERLRIGNLNGFLGYVTDIFGLGIGSTAKYMKYDPTNGLRLGGSGVARIELDLELARISVKDATDATKTAMGYLNGLAKHDGTGNWGAGDYGFWAAAGDNLKIDGDAVYKSGDWIVENDGSYLIQNAAAQTIIRLGTVSGVKGLFLYDTATPTQNLMAKFATDGLYLGAAGETSNYIKWDGATMTIRGSLNATDITTGYLSAARIDAGTISISQLDFVPVADSNVIATINASAEGIRIIGNRITIDGTVTFGSGYDPTDVAAASLDKVTYLTSGQTTIAGGQITTGTVTLAKLAFSDLAGLNAGEGAKLSGIATGADVTLTAVNNTLTITGGGIVLNAGGMIRGGQTDYATGTGFFLGYSGGAYKLSIGGTTNYLQWDGSSLNIGGTSVSTNGSYMVSVGKYCTSLGTQYPTTAQFAIDGQTHYYLWSGSAWVEIANIGLKTDGEDYYALDVMLSGTRQHGLRITASGTSSYGIYASSVKGIYSVVPSAASAAVTGIGLYRGGNFAVSEGASQGAPINLSPAVSSSPPSHSGSKGDIFVTNGGDMYINVTNGSGYGAWRTLGVSSQDLIAYALANGSQCIVNYGSSESLYTRSNGSWRETQIYVGG
jgi:hypothetical protein